MPDVGVPADYRLARPDEEGFLLRAQPRSRHRATRPLPLSLLLFSESGACGAGFAWPRSDRSMARLPPGRRRARSLGWRSSPSGRRATSADWTSCWYKRSRARAGTTAQASAWLLPRGIRLPSRDVLFPQRFAELGVDDQVHHQAVGARRRASGARQAAGMYQVAGPDRLHAVAGMDVPVPGYGSASPARPDADARQCGRPAQSTRV